MRPSGDSLGGLFVSHLSMEPLHEIQRAIGRLEAKVDSLKAQQEQIDKLQTRVESLEKWRSWLAGAVATLGVLWGIALKLIPFIPR